jgi:hypothetical protein
MTNRIIISLGTALIIGVITGYSLSERKYFALSAENPKREITLAEYRSLYDDERKAETVYNTQQAIVIGIATFGVLLVITSVFNISWLERDKSKKNS